MLEGGRFLVPVEALPRLLSPLLEQPVEWRAPQRVLVIGKVAVPRVTVSTFLSGDMARVVFEASEAVPFRVQQEPDRVTREHPARPARRVAASRRGWPAASSSRCSTSAAARTCSPSSSGRASAA